MCLFLLLLFFFVCTALVFLNFIVLFLAFCLASWLLKGGDFMLWQRYQLSEVFSMDYSLEMIISQLLQMIVHTEQVKCFHPDHNVIIRWVLKGCYKLERCDTV